MSGLVTVVTVLVHLALEVIAIGFVAAVVERKTRLGLDPSRVRFVLPEYGPIIGGTIVGFLASGRQPTPTPAFLGDAFFILQRAGHALGVGDPNALFVLAFSSAFTWVLIVELLVVGWVQYRRNRAGVTARPSRCESACTRATSRKCSSR